MRESILVFQRYSALLGSGVSRAAAAQPADRMGMGALAALFNHNVAPFLRIMAQESGKKPPRRRSSLSSTRDRLCATLCLTGRLMARLWVKPSPSVVADSKERR